jgi:hypothetical protein
MDKLDALRQTGDFHQWTADHDTDFHRLMDCFDAVTQSSPPWRNRCTSQDIRKYAKRYNFFRLYGWKAEDALQGQRMRSYLETVIRDGKSPQETAEAIIHYLEEAKESRQ